MAINYRIENFFTDLEAFLIANINTKIGDINTEYNDSVSLLTVDDNAYFFYTMNDKVANFDPIVYYGIADNEVEAIGPLGNKKYKIMVLIGLADTAQDVQIGKRLLRYSRVLEDLFNDNWNSVGGMIKVKVTNLIFSPPQTSDQYRYAGVELEVNIA